MHINYFKGFRDIYKKLIDYYNFIPKIPFCEQLEPKNENVELKSFTTKQLSTTQTSESRLVTKVNKQHLKASIIIF